MTCQEFDRIEPEYLAGTLSESEARGFEAHAAACAACERRLEATTRRDVSTFAPMLPPALRARTLAEVRARHQLRHAPRPWWAGRIAAAAAGVVFSILLVRVVSIASGDGDATPSTAAVQESTVVPDSVVSPAVTLALVSSREEFVALDAAIRELEAALVAAPGDSELRAFLASAVARRAELERQVKDAA